MLCDTRCGRVLVGTHEGNRVFGRLRSRWEVNINIDLNP